MNFLLMHYMKLRNGLVTYILYHQIQSIVGSRSPTKVSNMLPMTGKKNLTKITFKIIKKWVPSRLNPHFPTWRVHELEDKCIDQHYVPWWLSLHSAIFKYNLNPVLTTLSIILKYQFRKVIFITYFRIRANVYGFRIVFLIFLVYSVSVFIYFFRTNIWIF